MEIADTKDTKLRWLVHTALAYLGTPYLWGGDDPSGFDCSGFVVECLKSGGFLSVHADLTADNLWLKYSSSRIEKPEKGALLFTLSSKNKATHVVICLDSFFQIGASGGNSKTTSIESAWRDNAYVRIRPIQSLKRNNRICRVG